MDSHVLQEYLDDHSFPIVVKKKEPILHMKGCKIDMLTY